MRVTARQSYWRWRKVADMWRHALSGSDPVFRGIVLAEHIARRRGAVRPIAGETLERALAAVEWLAGAQDATPDDGVAYGYFPVSGAMGWEISYPETTGYIITSILAYAQRFGRADLVERARRMGHWEADVQMATGAVQGGKLTTPEKQTAAAFNTGMVLDGWVSLLELADDPKLAVTARKAADFLVADLDERGHFRTNGAFVSADRVKLFNVLCAWALQRFGRLTGDGAYETAAIRSVDAALTHMAPNGWLSDNCLEDRERPLTHTIGYALQGILEVGMASGRADYIDAARRGFEPIIGQIEPNGFLAGRFDAQWRPAVAWSCLTGSAQLAIVGYRLTVATGDQHYAEAADRLLNFLKPLQRLNSGNKAIDGALAGSFPIFGGYMQAGYPNWATKYLLDALMLQADRQG